MIEEIKELAGVMNELPTLAIVGVLAVFAYKTIIVGSIYGVIKFTVEKIHNWAVTPKEELIVKNEISKLERITISGCMDSLLDQLERLVGINTPVETHYIHERDVQWFRDAITEKMDREKEAGTSVKNSNSRARAREG